tara:strand:+ start:442 stop:816 length:375 start_codon:yes stop_codon:yes gene_type:complete
MNSFLEFLKKSWKFLLGFVIAIFGGMLLFRKDDSAELIEESTKSGEKSFNDIIEASEKREELNAEATIKHEGKISSIEEEFKEKKKKIILDSKKEIEDKLPSEDLEKATDLLARELEALNLDKS